MYVFTLYVTYIRLCCVLLLYSLFLPFFTPFIQYFLIELYRVKEHTEHTERGFHTEGTTFLRGFHTEGTAFLRELQNV
jgi:hypothetical protein